MKKSKLIFIAFTFFMVTVVCGNTLFLSTEKKVFAGTSTYINSEINYPHTLSLFKTSFKGGATNRVKNIKIAAQKINGTILKPGEVFSFNTVVGPTTKNNGFVKAKIFIKGEESEGYGGGVCQVSSTLYNSVLNANLPVIERHEHSKKVFYVGDGKDAATSYGYLDFKFKNTRTTPIILNASIDKENVYVRISDYII